ncbi:MAG TPA: AgmX/PglI C-terminal domain-containing protein [Kofleriaceae bacterium]|jgi:tetratricopeptide (TPR) repeat protein|nr:AgmX/PglI C-terminal domain-containing protein [Kofleriaceae bacterium]
MTRLSVLLVTLVALGACAGAQQEDANQPATPGPSAAPVKRVTSGDVSFDLPPIEVKGVVYEPDPALGRPGMPLVEAKRKTTKEKQKALVTSTKDPVQKQAQAAIYATMLYLEAKGEKDKATERAKLAEARDMLKEVADAAGDKAIDEITLRLLGSYNLLLASIADSDKERSDAYDGAEKAWQALLAIVEKDPKAKDVGDIRTGLAYTQLRRFKNAEALATVAAAKPDDKQPELAYVTAWAKLRTGDGAGAWQAMTTVVQGWTDSGGRDELERDVLFFAGRTPASLDQAAATIAALAKARAKASQQPQVQQRTQYEMLARLGLVSYALAGRWGDAVAALDKAVAVGGDILPPNDLPVIRYSQADFTVRLDAPEAAAKFAKQAIEAYKPCAEKCTAKDRADTIKGVYLLGQLFHVLYATANDHNYYEPAHQLYELVTSLPPQDFPQLAEAQTNLKKLETTLKNLKVGTGTHDKGALGALLPRHNLEAQACYEAVLGANPRLAGNVVVNLEADATGAIKGVATEPKAGAADLSAVAGCIAGRVKQWKLPKRGMPGTTRIKLTFALSVKAG